MDTGTMNGASVSSFVPTPVFTARVSLPVCLTRGAESRRAGSGRALGYSVEKVAGICKQVQNVIFRVALAIRTGAPTPMNASLEASLGAAGKSVR